MQRYLSGLLLAIALLSLLPSFSLGKTRLLNVNFYFHRELSGIENYRILNLSYPTRSDNNSIIQNVPLGIWEIGDGWISPEIPMTITLERAYNFLFSLWGGGNGKAILFFNFYAYRNGQEHFLFRSNPSEQLIINATEMLWQHRTKEVTLEIQEGDRLLLRLFINVSVSGRFGLGYDCTQYPSYVNDPSETRYMRSDDIVSGYYNLGTSQTTSGRAYEAYYPGSRTVYWGMRVWRKDLLGTETEITSGTPVAQVSRSTNGYGIQSATWNCSITALNSTDTILVRIYEKIVISAAWISVTSAYARSGWLTEPLGAIQLDNAFWNISYHTKRDYDGVGTYGMYYWGLSSSNSHIENFSWTPVVSKIWNYVASWPFTLIAEAWILVASWSFNLIARIWNPISSWILSLNSRSWQNINFWIFSLRSPGWNSVSSWIFSLETLGWHSIAFWIFSLTPFSTGFLLIPLIFLVGVVLFLMAVALGKKLHNEF